MAFYKWEIWGTFKLPNRLNITQLGSGRAKFPSWVVGLQAQECHHYAVLIMTGDLLYV